MAQQRKATAAMPTIKPTPSHLHTVVKPTCETVQTTFFPTSPAHGDRFHKSVSHFPYYPPTGGREIVKPGETGSAQETTPENHPVSQLQKGTCETVEELAVLRARLTNGYAWLQSRQGQPNALPNGAHLLRELILKEYLPAIRRWRERLNEAEQHDMAASYARKVDALEDDSAFAKQIFEYMAAEDIANPRLLQDLLDRVTFWSEAEHG